MEGSTTEMRNERTLLDANHKTTKEKVLDITYRLVVASTVSTFNLYDEMQSLYRAVVSAVGLTVREQQISLFLWNFSE